MIAYPVFAETHAALVTFESDEPMYIPIQGSLKAPGGAKVGSILQSVSILPAS